MCFCGPVQPNNTKLQWIRSGPSGSQVGDGLSQTKSVFDCEC